MRSVRAVRVWLGTAVLMLLGLVLAVLASPSASAALREDRAVLVSAPAAPSATTVPSLPPGSTAPRMLASTGLDLTVPVVLGLAILMLGTVMVGWAFLATGRRATGSGRTHR